MEIGYSIILHPTVIAKDIPRLDAEWKQKIRDAVRAKLTVMPELYGVPLRHNLKGKRKLRVGDYRVVYHAEKKNVRILAIGHRSEVYKEVLKRIG